ncbi:MAG: alpha/beta hydrolase [Candidatus Abyssubacteria bacterium]
MFSRAEKMPIATVNGIELSYLVADFTDPWKRDKQYLLLLHGWMGCKESWVRQIPFFSREFVVVAPDLRGFGQSAKPARGYALQEYVRDVAGLFDILSIRRAHLLGQSFGGIIAQLFAIQHPERTQSLVLWATRSEPTGSVDINAVAQFIHTHGMAAFAETFSGNFADEAQPEITEWNKRLVAEGKPHVAIETLNEVSKVNLTDDLHKIAAPTLILASREDKVIPFEYAQRMKRGIPRAKLYEYAGSHGAYLKSPDECNNTILGFLREITRKDTQR